MAMLTFSTIVKFKKQLQLNRHFILNLTLDNKNRKGCFGRFNMAKIEKKPMFHVEHLIQNYTLENLFP